MPVRFLADKTRCVKCGGCEAACKTQNKTPTGVRRIRVIELYDGVEGKELHIPMQCFHCDDAPCVKVCPPRTLYKRADGVVLHDKDACIGCGYCVYACPFGAPQFPGTGLFGSKGMMDKCSFCVQPFEQKDSAGKMIYNEAKPKCAGFCSTKALLAGESAEVSKTFRERKAMSL